MEASTIDNSTKRRVKSPPIHESHLSTKEELIELKHGILDLKKDVNYEISELRTHQKHDLMESIKELEMRMYSFIIKSVITMIGILGGIQTVFNFLK